MISFNEFLTGARKKAQETSKKEEIPAKPIIVEEKVEVIEKIAEETQTKIEEEIQTIAESVVEEPKHNPEPVFETVKEEIVEGYKIYRDKPETFICDMEISGANPKNSKARIIIESNELTYMFEGTINEKGQCKIPLKKMSFLDENETGKIKLEVIAEDMVFTPWQEDFVAVSSKKIAVKVFETVVATPQVGIKISNIR